MAGKFLDDNGLSYLVQKTKAYTNTGLATKVDNTVNPLIQTGFYRIFLKALEKDQETDTTTDPTNPGGNRAIKKALANSGVITSVSEDEAKEEDINGNLIYPNNAIALGLTSFKPTIVNKDSQNPLREEYYPPFDVKYLTDTDLAAENKLTLDYARKSGIYFYKESKDIEVDGKTLNFSDPYLSFVSRGASIIIDDVTKIQYNKVKQVLIGPTIKFRESNLSGIVPFDPVNNNWTEWTEFTWEDLINAAANHLPLPGAGTPATNDYILTYNTSTKKTKTNYIIKDSVSTSSTPIITGGDGQIPTTKTMVLYCDSRFSNYYTKEQVDNLFPTSQENIAVVIDLRSARII